MLISGLKSPVKNLAWLLGGLFFLLSVFYPPLPAPVVNVFYQPGLVFAPSTTYVFFHSVISGGIGWQVLRDLHTHILIDYTQLYDLAPFCALPVLLSLSAIVVWRFLVTREFRPTLLRCLLAVLVSEVLALVLVFLLFWVGGKVLLTVFPVSIHAALIARGLISLTWTTALAQSILLFVPCLVIGGLLSIWQEKFWLQYVQ